MKNNINIFFDRKAADGFDELIEIIYESFELLKKEGKDVQWNQSRDLSVYGFKLLSRSKKFSLFFGMYWHFWSDFGYPICLTLEATTGHINKEDDLKFKQSCDKTLETSTYKYLHYDGLNICGFEKDFFNKEVAEINELIYTFYLNLQLLNK
ncbi:MAG: hypothetical protein IM581_12240 [Chitinophagaceae bacterium]|nr:hypothetical protein [Chitinophagaceae bacterium]